jgi:hypothetical protein
MWLCDAVKTKVVDAVFKKLDQIRVDDGDVIKLTYTVTATLPVTPDNSTPPEITSRVQHGRLPCRIHLRKDA